MSCRNFSRRSNSARTTQEHCFARTIINLPMGLPTNFGQLNDARLSSWCRYGATLHGIHIAPSSVKKTRKVALNKIGRFGSYVHVRGHQGDSTEKDHTLEPSVSFARLGTHALDFAKSMIRTPENDRPSAAEALDNSWFNSTSGPCCVIA